MSSLRGSLVKVSLGTWTKLALCGLCACSDLGTNGSADPDSVGLDAGARDAGPENEAGSGRRDSGPPESQRPSEFDGGGGGEPTSGSDAGPAAVDSGDGEAVADSGGGEAALESCPQTPDGQRGLFVSVAGQDTSDCGSKGTPCRTLATGQARLQTSADHDTLYLGPGQFSGNLDLIPGVHLSGGWDAAWERDCDRPRDTVIKGGPDSGSGGLPVLALRAGEARLSYLIIEGQDSGQVEPGQSVYGLWTAGAAQLLELDQVQVIVPDAGDGSGGKAGVAEEASALTCGSGTGADGHPGADGQPQAGRFAELGYEPGHGAAGLAGTPGDVGIAELAQPGTALTFACASPCGDGIEVILPAGGDGAGGCGGAPGQGAEPGSGGGSSVAVWVGAGRLVVRGGFIRAGAGGDGGAGALGGQGGQGAPGRPGEPGALRTVEAACCAAPTTVAAPGGSAGSGGRGGDGGASAGGAGGYSLAIFAASAALVELDEDVVLQVGAPGAGGGGPIPGPAGEAQLRWP